MRTRLRSVIIAIAIQLGACARYHAYVAAPVSATDEAGEYEARRLDDSALAHVLAAHAGPVANNKWDSRALALAALYFRPELKEARHSLLAARAGEITAGVRPYPSVTATANRAAKADEGHPTAWSFSLTTGITLELGDKRGARISRARAFTLAAQLRLETAAWQVISATRRAASTALATEIDLADARAESSQLRSLLELLRARYNEGQIARADLARSEIDVQTGSVAITQASRARSDARSALARELAVPVREVAQLQLVADPRSACAVVDSVPREAIATQALRTLPIVGAALADYAVAEGDLRIQIAQAYPDIVVGPGIAWEQGIQRWILSLGLPTVPTDRNRGHILEAEAHRAAQAARVTVVQDSILAAVDSSLAACRHAYHEITVVDSLVRASSEQLGLARAAYQRGETGRTEIAFAQVALTRAQRARNQAIQREFLDGIALESATGAWLSGPPVRWDDLLMPEDNTQRTRRR